MDNISESAAQGDFTIGLEVFRDADFIVCIRAQAQGLSSEFSESL